ncbi:hypothetical protein Hanom_Chr16g01463931 [Helianthus anomalus]
MYLVPHFTDQHTLFPTNNFFTSVMLHHHLKLKKKTDRTNLEEAHWSTVFRYIIISNTINRNRNKQKNTKRLQSQSRMFFVI